MEPITFDLQRYAPKNRKIYSKEQFLAKEIIDYFEDTSVNFKSVYFGVIKRIGYQSTFESLREMKRRESTNAAYWWGIVRNTKKEIIFK